MKLDSREKYDRIRRFMGDLKARPSAEPFLTTEDIAKYGIYDFCYVNKNPPSFAKVEKKLKESKYDELAEFVEDMKQIFLAVSDYVFTDDPLQRVCEEFREEVDKFAVSFGEEFRNTVVEVKPKKVEVPKKPKEEQPAKPKQVEEMVILKDKPTNITEKLEMLFLMRANETNEPYIRSIGTAYGIGMETEDEYVITLDNRNTSWLSFISRSDP